MDFSKTPAPKKKRKGLRIALCALCLTGLVGYLSYFIAFHQTFDPYLTEEVQKQVIGLYNIENLANSDGPTRVSGQFYEDGEITYSFLFYSVEMDSPLLSLKKEKEAEGKLYQAEWNGETKASEFHFQDGDNFEKTFRILTYKELLATFISFTFNPDEFSYKSTMKNLSFDRKANYVKTTATYLPKEDWVFSLPKMGVTYSLSEAAVSYGFLPTDEYFDKTGLFGFLVEGDCGGKKVKFDFDFYYWIPKKTSSYSSEKKKQSFGKLPIDQSSLEQGNA